MKALDLASSDDLCMLRLSKFKNLVRLVTWSLCQFKVLESLNLYQQLITTTIPTKVGILLCIYNYS